MCYILTNNAVVITLTFPSRGRLGRPGSMTSYPGGMGRTIGTFTVTRIASLPSYVVDR